MPPARARPLFLYTLFLCLSFFSIFTFFLIISLCFLLFAIHGLFRLCFASAATARAVGLSPQCVHSFFLFYLCSCLSPLGLGRRARGQISVGWVRRGKRPAWTNRHLFLSVSFFLVCVTRVGPAAQQRHKRTTLPARDHCTLSSTKMRRRMRRRFTGSRPILVQQKNRAGCPVGLRPLLSALPLLRVFFHKNHAKNRQKRKTHPWFFLLLCIALSHRFLFFFQAVFFL